MQKKDYKIIERIQKIENCLFDEDDIKLLLIEIREKLKGEKFLKEVCHFIAHPDRDKGICHEKVDTRYAKLKFVEENVKKELTSEFMEKNKGKPERFFTDTMLNYIRTEKIDARLFELLILSGINDIDNELYQKYYRLTKKQVKRLISGAYEKANGFYIIKTTLTINEVHLIDDLLKFIRGTITGKPIFTGEEIFGDFIVGLKRLSTEINYRASFDKIKKNKDDLIVCIISLLHDSTFKLFDGNIGFGFISVISNDDENLKLCLVTSSGKYSFVSITTKISAKDYIDCTSDEIKEYRFKKLPWNNCIRNRENKLKLTKYFTADN